MPSDATETKNDKIARARSEFLESLRRTFGGPDGQRVLEWLHATAATRKPCFLPGDRDPNAAAHRDGRKSIVWEIEANLEAARESLGAASSHKPPTTGAPGARRQGP